MPVNSFLRPMLNARCISIYWGRPSDFIRCCCWDIASCPITSTWLSFLEKFDALATTLKQTHGRYASYWNATHRSSGHVWQGRFYSCPLDQSHLWIAMRYAELNPVRAGLVTEAESWR